MQATKLGRSRTWERQRCAVGHAMIRCMVAISTHQQNNADWLSCSVQNQFDSIDLSDNAVVRLEGFPKLPRLKMLLLNNNRIVRIAPRLEGRASSHADFRCSCMCGSHTTVQSFLQSARSACTIAQLHGTSACAEHIPGLECLVLTNNRLTKLQVRSHATNPPLVTNTSFARLRA